MNFKLSEEFQIIFYEQEKRNDNENQMNINKIDLGSFSAKYLWDLSLCRDVQYQKKLDFLLLSN